MSDIKRLNYFNGQFLVEDDFNDEQAYHLGMRRRLNQALQTWGIADGGLVVTGVGSNQVSVGVGMAIDKDGREIVLLDPQTHDLSPFGSNKDVYLTIQYQDVQDQADRYTSGGVDNYTRWTERPLVQPTPTQPPADGSVITLARVHLGASGNVETIDQSVRTIASSKIDPGSNLQVGSLTLTDPNVESANWAQMRLGASKRADLTGSLHVTGDIDLEGKLSGNLTSNIVDTSQIMDNAVTSAKIANNSIDTAKIADNAVTTAKIADGNVGTSKLANLSVTTAKIADGNVGTSKLANLSVTMDKIADNAVTAAKVQTAAIGTAQLADSAVSFAKLKLTQVWDSTTTLPANGTMGFNVLAVPLSSPRGAFILVYAYSKTNSGIFEWREQSSTGGLAPNLWINQTVYFHNLTAISIEIAFKIYMLLEG